MSFSQFIKISKIIGNFRQSEYPTEEASSQNNQETLKLSLSRPKSMTDKKISTNRLLKKNEWNNFVNKENSEDNLKNIYKSNDCIEIYENIIHILNNFINNNKSNGHFLCKYLKAIYKYIYDLNNNKKLSTYHSTIITNKSSKRIKKSKTSNTSRKFELKNQDFQQNEYNYLMYINELHKKLFKLEQDLKIKSSKKKTVKENIKQLFEMSSDKFYLYNQLKIRKTSFSIIAKKRVLKTNILLEKDNKKNNLKISLKDIINDCERNLKDDIKFYNNKKYLLSHPRLNFNGYFHNNNAKTSSIINERINRIPKEAFGIRLHTKMQSNYKSYLQLSFYPIKVRIEKLRANKNKTNVKL